MTTARIGVPSSTARPGKAALGKIAASSPAASRESTASRVPAESASLAGPIAPPEAAEFASSGAPAGPAETPRAVSWPDSTGSKSSPESAAPDDGAPVTGPGTTCGFAVLRECHATRSEEHTSELQSRENLVCRLLLEK